MFKKKSDEGFMSVEPVEPVIQKLSVKAPDPDVRKRNVSVIGPRR